MDVCTLGDLLDVVGGPSLHLRLHTAPAGLAAPVTEVLLYDAQASLPHAPGALLLAVGVRAADTGPLVRLAAEAAMTGVVVRGPDGPVGEAEARGVALLSVDEEAAWHHVHLLLSSAIGARPAPSAGGLGDLFALADAVAAATGGATAVEDPRQRILAYSTVPGQPVDEDRRQGILGLQVPVSPANTEQYRLLFAAPGPVRLPALREGDLPRLALAVRAGGETLGSVWVVDGGALAPDAEETLVQGASTAALLLLRARAAQELARHQNSDLLRRLLDGTADAATAAQRLGLEGPVRVAAFVLDAASLPDAEQTGLRLLDVVRLQCEARYGRPACVLLDGVVYAVLPAPGARHKRLAEDIVARAGQALRVPVRAALGEVVAGPAEVVGSREDAELVLRVLGPELPVATVDEVRPRVTLLRLAEVLGERRELSAGAWRRVLAYDEAHGTDYARTLVSWFDAGCDMGGAAKLLAVHANTCRYRLKQVQQHTGINLADPDERLMLWLQLKTLANRTP
ncbi:helix-turn-helix domain-containing protein [Streptomyces sp. NBC_00201]|uniref:PucR family transcriptional regulator n=1 Tax=unclassified Streptomyces TaxID=2593676 RepID=UPI002255C0BC|nr:MULTISPECIES: helix-turn-helix domain-containing protein [unclassified Streptomyces]MCX5048515.1 helix-turn-helix domain-containing protein [Streptomyces sp. NBC_00474]MCX5246338.1 helix-turn-helix domain-containing protein [Streptomyces sp. NBC_00201]